MQVASRSPRLVLSAGLTHAAACRPPPALYTRAPQSNNINFLPTDRLLSYLPLAHIFDRWVGHRWHARHTGHHWRAPGSPSSVHHWHACPQARPPLGTAGPRACTDAALAALLRPPLPHTHPCLTHSVNDAGPRARAPTPPWLVVYTTSQGE